MHQRFFVLAILSILCSLPAMASVNVYVSQPNTTSAVGSPVKLAASATSSHPITGWYVYADNATVYHQTGSTLSGSIALTTGSHNLTIRAWDSTGLYGTKYLTVNVQQQQKTTVFSHLEDSTGWGQCGTRSCAGGSGA